MTDPINHKPEDALGQKLREASFAHTGNVAHHRPYESLIDSWSKSARQAIADGRSARALAFACLAAHLAFVAHPELREGNTV